MHEQQDQVGQRVLITGASFGLGHELSKLYARDGYDLVLVARSIDKLEQDAQVLRQRYGVEVQGHRQGHGHAHRSARTL